MKRVFKTRSFDRWARRIVPDAHLCAAARDILDGRFEADLGQGLCKKRIALPGRGKRSGVRSLVAKRHSEAVFFLVGREKSDPGADFSESVVAAAAEIAAELQRRTLMELAGAIQQGRLVEICHEC